MSLIVSIAWIEPMMPGRTPSTPPRSEEHTSELQSRSDLVCRLLLEKKKKQHKATSTCSTRILQYHAKKKSVNSTGVMMSTCITKWAVRSYDWQRCAYMRWNE